jgi:hypothetical protein
MGRVETSAYTLVGEYALEHRKLWDRKIVPVDPVNLALAYGRETGKPRGRRTH